MEKKTCKLLIATTGSVAALKIPVIVKNVIDKSGSDNIEYEIRLIVTEHSKHFFKITELSAEVKVYDDKAEWDTWQHRGDPVLHIELGKWADMMLIAPLDANTLAKMSQGICDNLLTCTTRAWDLRKPLLFCPAMNTRMWEHPLTSQQIEILKTWGHTEIPPISKTLMCGDTGIGAMAEPMSIVEEVHKIASRS